MKRYTIMTLMVIAVTATTMMFTACGDDDDPVSVPEESLLIGLYDGTIMGNSPHFSNMPSTSPDTIIVTASAENSAAFDIEIRSAFWGNGTFSNVAAAKDNNGVWHFNETEGTFNMPKRTPSVTEITYNSYPATLSAAEVQLLSTDGSKKLYSFNVDVNLGERAGIYSLSLTNIEADAAAN